MRSAALLLLAVLSAPAPALAEPVRIAGRIANPQGLQGMQVELSSFPVSHADALRQLRGEPVPPLAAATPAADGSFTLQAPDTGFYRLLARADGRLSLEHALPLLVEDTELPSVELPAASPVEARTVGAGGKPLAGVTIRAHAPESGPGWRPADRHAVADPDGKATFFRAAGETLTLTVTDPGLYGVATLTASGPSQTVRFPAPRSRVVEVRDGQGRPAAGVLLRLARRGWPVGLTGPDGRIAMPIPARGELGLTLEDGKGLQLEVVMTQEAAEGTDVPVVTLHAPLAATGRVLDGAGRAPLAGALVWNGGSAWTRSGPRGDFELRAPSGDEGRIEAAARGRMSDAQPWRRDRNEPLTLVLDPAGTITGRVVDEDGLPVAGAELVLAPLPGPAGPSGSGPFRALADADGRFRFPDLPRGRRFDLEVFREGYVSASLPGVEARPGSPLRIELRVGRALAGRVAGPDGEPVAEAQVSVVETTLVELEGSRFSQGLTRSHARTDEEGRFLLAALEPGSVQLQVDAPGYRRRKVPGLQIPEQGEAPAVEIALERGASIAGRVLDGQGRPARGAMVRAEGGHTGDGVLSFAGGHADAEGRYRLDGLEAGPHQVFAESADRDLRTQGALEVRPGTNRLDLTFPSGVEVSGRAVDPRGEPVAGVSVHLWALRGGQARYATTTGNGSFTFADVVEGEYRLRGSGRGFATSSLPDPVRVGRAPVDGLELRLSPGVVIRGRILGLAPEDRDEIHVSAHVVDGGELAQGTVDSEGSYRIPGVGPGEWNVLANLSSEASAHGVAQVREGDEEVVLDLQLPEGFTLYGRVLLDREPLSGAAVTLRGGDRGEQGGRGPAEGHAQTAHDGSFSISHLPPGSYTLLAALSSGVGHIQTVSLDGDQEVTVEVQTGDLEGRVLSPDGLPVAGALVSLSGENPDLRAAFQGPSTRSDNQGFFELPRLAAGTYRVTVEADGFATAETRAVLTPGGMVRLDLVLPPLSDR